MQSASKYTTASIGKTQPAPPKSVQNKLRHMVQGESADLKM